MSGSAGWGSEGHPSSDPGWHAGADDTPAPTGLVYRLAGVAAALVLAALLVVGWTATGRSAGTGYPAATGGRRPVGRATLAVPPVTGSAAAVSAGAERLPGPTSSTAALTRWQHGGSLTRWLRPPSLTLATDSGNPPPPASPTPPAANPFVAYPAPAVAATPSPTPAPLPLLSGPQGAAPPGSAALGPAVPDAIRAWAPLILADAAATGVDPNLVAAVMMTESRGDPRVTSDKGAVGLMQVLGGSYDPATNVQQGVQILARDLATYHGDLQLSLSAYNAGTGAVARYAGLPPYQETETYVFEVLNRYYLYRGGG